MASQPTPPKVPPRSKALIQLVSLNKGLKNPYLWGEGSPARRVVLHRLVAELPRFGGSGGATIMIMGLAARLSRYFFRLHRRAWPLHAEEAAVRHDEVWSWGPVAYILMFPHGQAFKDAGFMQRVYDAGCRRGWKAQPVNEETTIQLTVLKSLGLLSGVSNCDLPWITFPARPEVTHFLVKHAQPQGFMCHICHLGSTNGKTCNQLQLQITSFQLRMSNIRTPKTIKKNYLKWHFHEMIIITLWIFRPLKCWYP